MNFVFFRPISKQKMSALTYSSKRLHIILRSTICGPLGLLFGDVFVLSCFSVGVGAFVIGLSQISSLSSHVLLSRTFHYIMGTLTFHTNGF